MTKKKPSADTKEFMQLLKEKNDPQSSEVFFSSKSNKSINSQNKTIKINECKDIYQTPVKAKNEDNRIDDSLTNNTNSTICTTKKDFFLDRTYAQSQGNLVEPYLSHHEISAEKPSQKQQLSKLNSFFNPTGQQEVKSAKNLSVPKVSQNMLSSQNIFSTNSFGIQPFSATSLYQKNQKFNTIQSMQALDSARSKDQMSNNGRLSAKNKNKKELTKQQLKEKKEEEFIKFQPKLVTNKNFFEERNIGHETDSQSLKNNKELEIDIILGVHKKKQYNILEHDVDTFADNVIARQILTTSNCIPYKQIKFATSQNLTDSVQEKNEFGFCRKILQLKKQGMSSTFNEKEKGYSMHSLNNDINRESHDQQVSQFLQDTIQRKKKAIEDNQRIKSLNLDGPLIPQEKQQDTGNKFKQIMLNHSKQLGLQHIKRNLKKSNGIESATDLGQTKSLKNIFFTEEEEQLDEVGKLKKTQNINKETIKLQLTELDSLLQNANQEIQNGQKHRYNKKFQSCTDLSDKKKNQQKTQEQTISEKMAKEYGKLSNSSKYYVAQKSGQRINTFFDLVNSKMRLGRIQKEEEQKTRLQTPVMKKTLNEAVRRASLMRQNFGVHNFQ